VSRGALTGIRHAFTARRAAVAVATSALAALALAIAVVGRGCRVGDPGPDAAVHDLMQAARTGDRKAVFELLSPETQRRLDERAQNATSLVGASVRYTALDLISIGSFEDQPAPGELRVVEQYGDKAVVEIESSAGKARIALVKVDGRWRIDLPEYGSDF
jgi:hypothetical protein